MTSSPAHTSVSLFASAMSLPASIAASVGSRPTMPTTAVTTISAPLSAAQAVRPSMPESTQISVSASLILRSRAASSSNAHTILGCSARACSSSKFMRLFVVNATTSASTDGKISTVCVPIDPVEPKIAIFFISVLLSREFAVRGSFKNTHQQRALPVQPAVPSKPGSAGLRSHCPRRCGAASSAVRARVGYRKKFLRNFFRI